VVIHSLPDSMANAARLSAQALEEDQGAGDRSRRIEDGRMGDHAQKTRQHKIGQAEGLVRPRHPLEQRGGVVQVDAGQEASAGAGGEPRRPPRRRALRSAARK